MLWIILLVFGVPLFIVIQKLRSDKKQRERRLAKIQKRLEEKAKESSK